MKEPAGTLCQCPSCLWAGDDALIPGRVCEACGADEPPGEDHGQHCPKCDREVWWLPKCPDCGCGCNWLYGGETPIGPRDDERSIR